MTSGRLLFLILSRFSGSEMSVASMDAAALKLPVRFHGPAGFDTHLGHNFGVPNLGIDPRYGVLQFSQRCQPTIACSVGGLTP